MISLTNDDIRERTRDIVSREYDAVYGIPKGGMIVTALYIGSSYCRVILTLEKLKKALDEGRKVLIVDDIKDSGYTEKKLKEFLAPHNPDFFFVVDKEKEGITDWVQFPWNDWDAFRDDKDKELRALQRKDEKTSKEWAQYYEAQCTGKAERLKHLIELATKYEGKANMHTQPFGSRAVSLTTLAYENTGGYGRCVAYYMEKLGKIKPLRKVKESQPTLKL
jgi:hypoxanthine phosphoribosyltransferase